MKSSSTALGQRFTGFAADNFHSIASPGVFERIVFRYGLAVLSVAIALGVKLILLHFNFPYPLSTSFLLAIAITFWYAGTGPGILSVFLSFIAFAFFVLPNQVDYRIVLPDGSTKPVYVSGVSASHIQYFFYFALLALLMSWFSSSRRRAEQSLSQARRELETKVEERTAKLSLANEELQTEIGERKSAEEKLQRSKAFLSEGQRISHTGSWSWNVSSGKVTWSGEHFRIFGFDPEKTEPSFQLFLETVHPEDRSFIQRDLEKAVREKSGFDMEFRIALTDGSIKHVQGVGRPVLGAAGEVESYIGTTVDITQRKRGEALFAGEKRLLEMIATGVALNEILNVLCLIIEDYRPDTLASILLLRCDGRHLDSVAGPSLHKGWHTEMEELPIGPCAGSCGTAAYRGSPVMVSDIATDPLWEVPEHRAAALSHGLRASWSNPIFSSDRKVLGTFCIYGRETRSPSAQDLGLIEKATHLARVAIERDRAEAAVRNSEQKYRDLVDTTPAFVHTNLPNGDLDFVNRGWLEYLGLSNTDLLGSRWTSAIHREDVEELVAKWRAALESGEGYVAEARVRRGDGEYRLFLHREEPLRNEAGEIVKWYGSAIEIEERKIAEEKIREQEIELRQILDLSPQHVMVSGPDGSPLYANQVAIEYYGVGLEQQLLGESRINFVHPDDRERFLTEREKGVFEGRPHEFETRLLRHDGKFRWFLVRRNPLKDEQGHITRWFVTATDIEDRKQAEEKLRYENVALREELGKSSMFEEVVGSSSVLQSVLERAAKVAPTDSTVLIMGETGTGKELIARAIHLRPNRPQHPFITVNCAAVPASLIMSEWVGHETGALTG